MIDELEVCTCSAVRRAARTLTDVYDRLLEPSGLLSTQYSVLRNLEERAMSISDLADVLHLDRTTLGRNLRLLQADKLVRFSSGDDRRQRVVSLTSNGRNALSRAKPLWRNAQKLVRTKLGGQKQRALLVLLDGIYAVAD